MLATLWRRWGLDRRIALVSLLGLGTGTRQHLVVWFVIAAILSSVLPNAVVAAAMMPIVLAMLRFIGIEDVGQERVRLGAAHRGGLGHERRRRRHAARRRAQPAGRPVHRAAAARTTSSCSRRGCDACCRSRVLLSIASRAVHAVTRFTPEIERVEGSRGLFQGPAGLARGADGAGAVGPRLLRRGDAAGVHAAALCVAAARARARVRVPGVRRPELRRPPQRRAAARRGSTPSSTWCGG